MIPEAVDSTKLVPVATMRGDSDADTQLLRRDLAKAEKYITSQSWCLGISERYFGVGVGGIVAVFLFRIVPAKGADEWNWVVSGDLPCMYLVTDQIATPKDAIEEYCSLTSDWVEAVQTGAKLDEVFPVEAKPTRENASQLGTRIKMLRDDIMPAI